MRKGALMAGESYTQIQAKIEATRCLMCADAPCACDCPSSVDARGFIRKIRFDNLEGAVRSLKSKNILAASCSYICPTGKLCCKGCLAAGISHPIDISGLQRFVMEWERKVGMIEPKTPTVNGKRAAIVGSGPAGLGCAAELAVRGHQATVFEKESRLGGVLRQCIPSFRLPPEVIDFEIEFIKKLGIEFVSGQEIDSPEKLMKDGFKAIFLATGLTNSSADELIGSKTPGVYRALDFLKLAKCGEMPTLGKRVVVIGGGDTALDAARVAKRSGAESFVIYRRTQGEMPAYGNDIDDAWNEGVEFYFRTIVRAVIGEGAIKGVRCVRIKWHDKVPGIKQAYDVEGQDFIIPCDTVIIATGQRPASTFGLREQPGGLLAVDKETFETSEKGIFAGGDLVGGGTAARAVGMGRNAAIKMDEYLRHKRSS